jgi:predicted enzyme related to lactoylglutathione lyase
MANPVGHFEIMVTGDVDRIRKFYADAFGWKIDASNPMNYGLVDTGRGIGGGIAKPMQGPGYVTVYVEVADIEKALDKIVELGGTTLMPPMDVPNGPRIAMFKDPAGTVIGLMKR